MCSITKRTLYARITPTRTRVEKRIPAMTTQRYCIHYTEKGHGKRIKGRIYNGLKRRTIRAMSEEKAVARLREGYVEDGIREIRYIELLSM